ncbi:hypothetical protein GCM10010109_87680 [Actinoplanes campanulatus]|nr:hypothetical protein GCM10010109_87680 [Actinoplanes campanulatus]GID42231.1 hypothetical protein Aca09nite_87370 [Actinoplanes campanulatus]
MDFPVCLRPACPAEATWTVAWQRRRNAFQAELLNCRGARMLRRIVVVQRETPQYGLHIDCARLGVDRIH